jgi:hemerythrin-like domain-containing protein
MTDPIATWHADHVHFTWLLEVLERQVLAFHSDDHPDYGLMLDIAYYLRHFPDRFHHPREDVAFAQLVRHAPEMAPLVDRLVQEHRVIGAAGDELLKCLNQVVDEAVIPRAAVEAAAATYLAYYRAHLVTEETKIMPEAERLLTAEDWAKAAAAIPHGADPLFGKDMDERYKQLRREIAIAAGKVQ